MMLPPRLSRPPRVACAEEYDSDASSVRPGTRVEARSDASRGRTLKPIPRTQSQRQSSGVVRDGASDSGYSSHASATNPAPPAAPTPALAPQPARRQPAPYSQTRSKPVVHRSDSTPPRQPSQQRPPAAPVTRTTSSSCVDPGCTDPTCLAARNRERRYTIPQPAAQPSSQQQTWQPSDAYPQRQQQPTPAYQYAQPAAAQPDPTFAARPRLRTASTPRPVSWTPGANYSVNYTIYSTATAPAHGPPPSPSAYANVHQSQYTYAQPTAAQTAYQSSQPYLQPARTPSNFITPSPMYTASQIYPTTSHTYTTRPSNIVYSTRQPAVTGYAVPSTAFGQPQPPPLTRTTSLSARRPDTAPRPMPGTYPSDSHSYDSYSSTASDTDSEYERETRRGSKRKSRMVPPPRRPSIHTSQTTPIIPSRQSRESPRRAPRSCHDLDLDPQDYVDSDRTARPVLGRHYSSAASSRSRRPSVSTTASSSDRTKATTVSSGSGAATAQIIIDGPNGRRREYLSRQQHDDLLRRLRQQKVHEDAEAYQAEVRGEQPVELTAENIKQAQQPAAARPRAGSSHASAHSRKSSRSSQSKKPVDGIQLVYGGAVFHLAGDTRIEMRAADDAGPAQVFIDRASGRERGYHPSSSRSSGSRLGRSGVGGSDKGAREQSIREE